MIPFILFVLAAIWLIPVCSLGQLNPSKASQTSGEQQARLQLGEQLFSSTCAGCHADSLQIKAPKLSSLQQMTTRGIYMALTTGKMISQAASLNDEQRRAVAEWIKGQPLKESILPDSTFISFSLPPKVALHSGWGGNFEGTGYMPAKFARITSANVASLRVKWVFAFPEVSQMRSKPAIVGEWLLVGSQFGDVFAIHQKSGKVGWQFKADAPIRGSVFVQQHPQGPRAYFADNTTNVYALEVATGKLIWKKWVGEHPQSSVTGSVTVYQRKVIIPLSSREAIVSADSTYGCCSSSGEVVCLDASTGELRWRHRVVEKPATESGRKRNGKPFYGPSGAPVWCSPTIDTMRNRVYIGTGENYSPPATSSSDALQALDLNTGKVVWTFQATKHDTWNLACPGQPNCPDQQGPDFDFGMAPLLVRRKNGKDLLLAGQKSGVVHALDAATGKLQWQTRIGKGGWGGGVHWGMATDGTYLYAANSDRGDLVDASDSTRSPSPGMYALEVATGNMIWKQATVHSNPVLCGNSAAPLLLPELVFAGSLDGKMRAYEAKSGKVLWEYDTAREFITVNGIAGKGDSIDGPSPVAWEGMLFVNSGYSFFGQTAGNVLIAFEVEQK